MTALRFQTGENIRHPRPRFAENSPFLHICSLRSTSSIAFSLGFILLRGIFKLQINCIFIVSGRLCQRKATSFVFPEISGTLIMEFTSVS